jgi:hypothetical protein
MGITGKTRVRCFQKTKPHHFGGGNFLFIMCPPKTLKINSVWVQYARRERERGMVMSDRY